MTFDINIGLSKLLVFIAINSFKLIVCLYVSDWYRIEVKFRFSHTQIVRLKFPDEHPRPFSMGVPPPPGTVSWTAGACHRDNKSLADFSSNFKLFLDASLIIFSPHAR